MLLCMGVTTVNNAGIQIRWTMRKENLCILCISW